MGRHKAIFVDNFRIWDVSTHVKQEIGSRAKSDDITANGWGHGPVVKSIVKQPVLTSIVKGFGTILSHLRPLESFKEMDNRENPPTCPSYSDADIDALFEEEEDELFPDLELDNEQDDLNYLEDAKEPPQKRAKKATRELTSQMKKSISSSYNMDMKFPGKKKKEKKMHPIVYAFLTDAFAEGERGCIGKVPVAFQKGFRYFKKSDAKVMETEAYDSMIRLLGYLRKNKLLLE